MNPPVQLIYANKNVKKEKTPKEIILKAEDHKMKE
jgi:hypothetical protein